MKFSEKYNKPLFLSLLFGTAIALSGVIYSQRLIYPPIRSDVVGYYMYLPATILYHDVSAKAVIDDQFFGSIPSWTGVLEQPDGRYLIQYPLGMALVQLPLFLLATVVAWLLRLPANGFSWPFLYAVPLTGIICGVAGMGFLWSFMRRYFKENTIILSLTAILFGSNLFHHLTYDSIFSHIVSFGVFCLFLWLLPRIFEDGSSGALLAAGAVIGLITVIRVTNFVWVLNAVAFGIFSLESFRERVRFLYRKKYWILGGGLLASLPVLFANAILESRHRKLAVLFISGSVF